MFEPCGTVAQWIQSENVFEEVGLRANITAPESEHLTSTTTEIAVPRRGGMALDGTSI